jgi:hypothetical protein
MHTQLHIEKQNKEEEEQDRMRKIDIQLHIEKQNAQEE